MKKTLFSINLILFGIVWIGITLYTILAIRDPEVFYSAATFWLFIFLLDILVLPLISLWWKIGPKTITHKVWVLMATLIAVFWWGFFTVYSFLSMHLNSLQYRWIAFAYIWEVVVVGAIGAYLVARIAKFSQRFLDGNARGMKPEDIHGTIATIPLRASAVFAGVVTFGYIIGSFQLYYFSGLPSSETAKNLLTGIMTGIFGSLLLFFLLEKIIHPVLKQSGMFLESSYVSRTRIRRRFSLFTKIYAVSAILVFISVGFFGAMAYGMGQSILEEQLALRLRQELTAVATHFAAEGILPPEADLRKRFGEHGEVRVLNRIADEAVLQEHIVIERDMAVTITGTIVLDDHTYIQGTLFESDFDGSLNALLIYSILVFLMLLVIVSVTSTFFTYSITRPIDEIKAGSIRMGEGNFSVPITVYTDDELEDMGVALNNAARKLKTSYLHLEEEVEKRTKQVAETNVKLKEQVDKLDRTTKRLVRRDFELQQANEWLREIDEAKTHFVSVAAHQLRTPLSAIKWTLHLFLSGDLGVISEEQKRILGEALGSTTRLITLVGDLLNVARIESGKMAYYKSEFQPKGIIDDLIREISPQAKEKKLTLQSSEESRDVFPQAVGDRDKLMQALLSIAENAINYTPEGGMVRISLRKPDESHYQVEISDTGIGIPKHQQQLLFQKFFRADNVLRQKIQGTGLALYIAHRIIQAHGGTIEAQSEENQGSIFIITLPFISKIMS